MAARSAAFVFAALLLTTLGVSLPESAGAAQALAEGGDAMSAWEATADCDDCVPSVVPLDATAYYDAIMEELRADALATDTANAAAVDMAAAAAGTAAAAAETAAAAAAGTDTTAATAAETASSSGAAADAADAEAQTDRVEAAPPMSLAAAEAPQRQAVPSEDMPSKSKTEKSNFWKGVTDVVHDKAAASVKSAEDHGAKMQENGQAATKADAETMDDAGGAASQAATAESTFPSVANVWVTKGGAPQVLVPSVDAGKGMWKKDAKQVSGGSTSSAKYDMPKPSARSIDLPNPGTVSNQKNKEEGSDASDGGTEANVPGPGGMLLSKEEVYETEQGSKANAASSTHIVVSKEPDAVVVAKPEVKAAAPSQTKGGMKTTAVPNQKNKEKGSDASDGGTEANAPGPGEVLLPKEEVYEAEQGSKANAASSPHKVVSKEPGAKEPGAKEPGAKEPGAKESGEVKAAASSQTKGGSSEAKNKAPEDKVKAAKKWEANAGAVQEKAGTTCAVVFSSGVLLKHELGSKIDENDFVIRMNGRDVPSGFEKWAGSKTTHQIIRFGSDKEFFKKNKYRGQDVQGIWWPVTNDEEELWSSKKTQRAATAAGKTVLYQGGTKVSEKDCRRAMGLDSTPYPCVKPMKPGERSVGCLCTSGGYATVWAMDRCSKVTLYGTEHDPAYPFYFSDGPDKVNHNTPKTLEQLEKELASLDGHHNVMLEHKKYAEWGRDGKLTIAS